MLEDYETALIILIIHVWLAQLVGRDDTPDAQEAVEWKFKVAGISGVSAHLDNELTEAITLPMKVLGSILKVSLSMMATSWAYLLALTTMGERRRGHDPICGSAR